MGCVELRTSGLLKSASRCRRNTQVKVSVGGDLVQYFFSMRFLRVAGRIVSFEVVQIGIEWNL